MTLQFFDEEPVAEPQPVTVPQPIVQAPIVQAVAQPVQPQKWFSRRSFLAGVVVTLLCVFGIQYIRSHQWIDDGGDDTVVTDKGFRVMVVYEADDVKELTEGQQACLTSIPVRKWLDENCEKEDGNNGYWIGDVDTPLDKLSESLQEMRKAAKPPYPCVIVANPPKKLSVEELGRDIEPQRFIQLLSDHK